MARRPRTHDYRKYYYVMPSNEESVREPAGGWTPKPHPNYDWEGNWTGPVPDFDKPVNEQYNAARTGDSFTRFPYGESLDEEDLARWQARVDIENSTRSLTAFTMISDPQAWRDHFTRECTELGIVVNYDGVTGDIHIPVQGLVFTNKVGIPATETALAWLGAEKVKAAKHWRAEYDKAAKEREMAEAIADPVANPVNHPATLQAILDRLDSIEKKINGL